MKIILASAAFAGDEAAAVSTPTFFLNFFSHKLLIKKSSEFVKKEEKKV
jgi:hypothetical protein